MMKTKSNTPKVPQIRNFILSLDTSYESVLARLNVFLHETDFEPLKKAFSSKRIRNLLRDEPQFFYLLTEALQLDPNGANYLNAFKDVEDDDQL